MVRTPSVDKNGVKRGAWSEDEDKKLIAYIQRYGHWNWRQLPKFAGLARCGKSCRLRYLNYLKPGLKKGTYNKEEEEMIIKLHQELGNKWSTIAAKLPGRTDNEIKNYWNSHLKKKMQQQDQDQESSKRKTNNNQDSSISNSNSNLNSGRDISSKEISSSNGNQEIDHNNSNSNSNSFNSDNHEELLVYSKFFEDFWTEPFYPTYENNNFSDDNSRLLELEFQDLIIAENEIMNLQEQYSSSSSSSSSCVDEFGDLCWTTTTGDHQPPEAVPEVFPAVEEGMVFPLSPLEYSYYDVDDLFSTNFEQ